MERGKGGYRGKTAVISHDKLVLGPVEVLCVAGDIYSAEIRGSDQGALISCLECCLPILSQLHA